MDIESKKIWFDSFKKFGKMMKFILLFYEVCCMGILIGWIVCFFALKMYNDEFMRVFSPFGLIEFIIGFMLGLYCCSKKLYFENGSMYSKNIFKSKTVKLESGMRVVLGTGKTPIDKTVIIRKDGVELFRYNIEMFNDDAPRMRENADIIKEICEKYDMEFVNYWGDMRYE